MNKNFDIFYDKDNSLYQIRTQSECIVVEFDNSEYEAIFNTILKMYEKVNFLTSSQIIKQLQKEYSYDHIIDVLKEMLNCKVLDLDNFENTDIDVSEKSYPIYFNGLSTNTESFHLFFLGSKDLEQVIKEKAHRLGYKSFLSETFNEQISESNIDNIVADNDLIILDISSMNPRLVKHFNRKALELNRPWVLMTGMIDIATYSIGPIFHGHETGCYECYESRIDSNDINYMYTNSYRKYLNNTAHFSKRGQTNSMIDDIAADIVLDDITKYITGVGIPQLWKHNIFIDVLDYSIRKDFVLRAPICDVCNPKIDCMPSPWLEGIVTKINDSK